MTISNFQKVCDFNKTFGLPHFEEEQLNVFDENPKLVKLIKASLRLTAEF